MLGVRPWSAYCDGFRSFCRYPWIVSEERPQLDYYVDFHQGEGVMLSEEEDAEDILVPPPQYGYGYVEEKMPLMVAAMDQEAEEEEEEARK